MKFSASTILAALAYPLLALAQNANPFSIPMTGLTATAGQTVTLTWNPTTQGTVSLSLRSGASNNLDQGQTFASNIPNSGSYTWTVPRDIVRGSDYTFEIRAQGGELNFTPPFVIESTNTVPTAITGTTTGTATTTGTTGTSETGSTTGTATTRTTGTTSGTASTTGTSSSGSMTSRTTMTGSSSSAGFQSSSASGQSTGGAPRATAAAGMMGLIALGAMAL